MKTEEEIQEVYEESLKKLRLPICRCGCEDAAWDCMREEADTLRWVLDLPKDEVPTYPRKRKHYDS
jgi:hypothetical protein